MQKCFLHVDLDAFFASVEQLDHPEWKGKPVIVGGLPGERRSVVSTASYEARKFGVHSAMPTFQAYKLCPQGIFTHGNYRRYSELSQKVMNILKDYSPDVMQLSIDEASMEITGTEQLFGPPLQVAETIQNRIFSETGLTASIGIASTKYLSKLGSEVNKPKGLFQIPFGKEEEFMLNLPLKEVWGIGSKTLERLNNAGFKTTRDIHSRSLPLLKTIFGENLALFLYNTVRGIETETAPKEHNHSISAETTFEYDLTDIYAAETSLLALCHSVMFRMLNEKSVGKTIMLKIRYEDFSTFTCQSTQSEYITSIDDFYNRICTLFESKYHNDKGIRLLGVGIEKIESEQKAAIQETLFDFGEKKKQTVEKSILELTKKHPEIKLQKARLLKAVSTVFLTVFLLANNTINAQETVHKTETETSTGITLPQEILLLPVPEEAPSTLFSYDIKNSNIEFLTQGWWQGAFSAGGEASFNKDGSTSFSFATPIFKQEVDLSLWFMINKQWYFETNFQDQFNKNTISLGFNGKESNPLKSVKISNRGIIFPDTYSASDFSRSIGGGQNQAPGILVNFRDPVNDRWTFDTAIRYDMTEQKSATFYGFNNVTTTEIELKDWITGQFYRLPKEALLNIKDVILKQSDNNFITISKDNFLIDAKQELLILSKDCGAQKKNGIIPELILTFENSVNLDDILGNWTESSSFLGEIQQIFSNYNLEKFSYSFKTVYNGSKALIIQSSRGFSPFVIPAYYDLGLSKVESVYAGNSETKQKSSSVQVEIANDQLILSGLDYFNEKHTFAKVNNSDSENLAAQNQFPFYKECPLLYLSSTATTDTKILAETYTKQSSLSIGTGASQGSVRVYKNGILDSGAKYDTESGEITLSSSVSDTDKIYITWQEDNSSFSNGKIAFQSALKYNFTKSLSGDVSLQGQWPLSINQKYAEYEKDSLGHVSLSSKIEYKNNFLEAYNSVLAGYENKNTKGIYRVEGFDQNTSKTTYLNQYCAYLTPDSPAPEIGLSLQGSNQAESSITGLKDEIISGYKIPLEFNFNPQDINTWASIQFSLADGTSLAQADSYEQGIRLSSELPDGLYSIYIQLGINADTEKKLTSIEEPVTFDVTNQIDFSSTSWQTLYINLGWEHKAKLTGYHDVRFIVVKNQITQDTCHDILYIGPHQINKTGMFAFEEEGSDDLDITSTEVLDNSLPDYKKLNNTDNYVQKIKWTNSNSLCTKAPVLSAISYINPLDISDYQNLEFYLSLRDFKDFNVTDQSSESHIFTMILDTAASSVYQEGKTAIKIHFTKEALSRISRDSFSHVKFNLSNHELFINKESIPVTEYEIETIDTSVIPTRIKIDFTTINPFTSNISEQGTILIDEILLTETNSIFVAQDKAKIQIIKNDSYLKTEALASYNRKINDEKNYFNIYGLSEGNLSLSYINLKAQGEFNSDYKTILTNANHDFSISKPIFGIFSFYDKYVYSPLELSVKKENYACIDLQRIKVPLKLSTKTNSKDTSLYHTQLMNYEIVSDFSIHKSKIKISSNLNMSQIQDTKANTDYFTNSNYFLSWTESTKDSFSLGDDFSQSRKITSESYILLNLPVAEIKPRLQFNIEEQYSQAQKASFDKTIILFSIPFKINKNDLSFSYSKESGQSGLLLKNENYAGDFYNYGNSFALQNYIWQAPFYELFSDSAKNIILQNISTSSASQLYSNTSCSLKWKRPQYKNALDIFVPSTTNLILTRNIKGTETINDNYVLKLTMQNSPINLFGKSSRLKLFSWYKTDEFTGSLSSTIKIPKENPSQTEFNLNTYLQASFFVSETKVLKTGFTFELSKDYEWETTGTLLFKRDTIFSPIISAIKLFDKKHDYSKIKLNRSNSINYSIAYKDESLNQDYKINHTISAQINKYISVNTGFTGEFTSKTNKASILQLLATIGGKVEF